MSKVTFLRFLRPQLSLFINNLKDRYVNLWIAMKHKWLSGEVTPEILQNVFNNSFKYNLKSLPTQISSKTLQAIVLRQERWEHSTISPFVLIAGVSPYIHMRFSINSHNFTYFHYILHASFDCYHVRIYAVVTLYIEKERTCIWQVKIKFKRKRKKNNTLIWS